MKVRLKAVSAVAFFLALFLAAPAGAHTQTVLDRDDTPGLFDVAAARQSHRTTDSGKILVTFGFVTYEAWTDDDFHIASIEISLDRDTYPERCVVVKRQEEDGGLYRWKAVIFKGCTYFTDEQLGETRQVTRPDEHSLSVTVPRRLIIRNGVPKYKWRVVTGYVDDESTECPPGEPGTDGTDWGCRDVTAWKAHEF